MSIVATTYNSVTVAPAQNRWESALLLLALAGLILTTAIYTFFFGRGERVQLVAEWQLSAYSELSNSNQSLYAELLVAANEIVWLRQESGDWPDLETLQNNWIPPFYEDSSWINRGSLIWQMRSGEDLAIYLGHLGQMLEQGALMMILDREYAGTNEILVPSVWWHQNNELNFPQSADESSLILSGWKEIIPYQGIDERARLYD